MYNRLLLGSGCCIVYIDLPMLQNISSLFVKFFGAIISYGLTIYISKYFGNEALGYFSFFLSYSLIYTLIMKLGTEMFLMKWVSRFTAEGHEGKARYLYTKIIRYHLIAGGIITLLGVVLTPIIFRHLFPRYTDIHFFQIALISVFFVNLHAMNYEFIRGKQKAVAYTFYYTTSIFFFILLIHVIQDLFFGYHYISLAFSYLLAAVVSVVISFIHVWTLIGTTTSIKAEGMEWKYIFSNSFPYFSNNAIFILIGTTDVFILSNYVSPTIIGEYALLVKFATFTSFPLVVLSGNFAPKILHYSGKEMLNKDIIRLTRIVFSGSLLLFIAVLLAIPFVMEYLNSTIEYGVWIYIMIAAGYLFSASCAMNEVSLLMLGLEKLYQKIMILALLLNFVLNLLLIPYYGVMGAAATTMLTLIFWNVLAVYFARKKLNISTSIIF